MEIRQIYYVLEIAKYRSFSKAARELYVTQPAISHQINALEEELQTKLFRRDTHNVSLTSDGEKFCEYATKIIESIDDLYHAFDLESSDEKPVLRIGVFPFYGKSPLRQTLTSFFAVNHNVVGNIRVLDNYQAYEKIQDGELDFAVIKERPENLPDLGCTVLNSEMIYAVISRELFTQPGNIMPLKDLGRYPLLSGEKDSHFYKDMKKLYEENDLKFNVSFMNTSEIGIMQEMVRDGYGLLLATESVAKSLENDTIVALPVIPTQVFQTVLLYPKKRKMRGAYLAFQNFIIDSYKEDSE
ncbi:MAG: LysR family transcriptional regulator [Mogibacterium sp.]|nr:LysR family transcriptional regulator [Mogibacterium sp.]